jgi:outer membrane protein insertion porin family
VFSYLPINVGETLDLERTPEIIRELYSTGFFDDIELLRRDNILVVKVVERPSIAEVNFEGNDDIEDEALEQALEQVGMSKGRIFDQNKLEKLELELQQVYYSLGKYAARIDADWRKIDEDRIAIDITISEGISATIKSINITGNQDFEEEELLELFQLETSDSGWFSDDEYSSTKLTADLESLKSYYLDQGYVQFQVVSQQVTISPDRKDITISININEGKQFRVGGIKITGEMVVDEVELQALVSLREGDVVSRKRINSVVTAMQKRLGEDGYAYANVRVASDVNEEEQTVMLQFIVLPGKPMRVRYIKFVGNEKTKDLVLRREMRQFEGEMYRRSKVDRSRVRLQRLNYIGSANIRLVKVPDVDDQVDLEVEISERFSGNLQLGLGYSQVQGVILNLGFAHENVFGSGNSLKFNFDNSAASERYSLAYENPYYTADGISRGFNLSFTETDASENNTSNYLIDRIRFSVDYGIPLSEFNRLRLEIGVLRDDFKTTGSSSQEVYDFVRDTSDEYDDATPNSEIDGEKYDTVFTTIGLSKDTRNRRIFADSGHLNSIGLEVHSGDLYGEGYGDTDDLPIYEKYNAGGIRTVRGYEFNSLGPLDSEGNSLGPLDSEGDPVGGNLQVITNTELLFPIEALGSSETFRLGLYFDAGNVFADAEDFESEELRQSVGVSAKWFSFIGPIEFSYAVPVNDESGDDVENFQFALGASF